ncbi:single-stranded-DNA-specific exonuclease RecJ [Patescibacteria group bacterium]
MSFQNRKWIIKNLNTQKSAYQKVLENRGNLNFDKNVKLHDPFLFGDMEKAIDRIHKAIKSNERIIVFGDYDVDGISGTAILVHLLKELGAQVSYRIPNRVKDGYGFTEKFIQEFIENDVSLVITVDCGISCHKEIKKAASQGIDFIVTDHHQVPAEIPKHACAILHPGMPKTKYPFKDLTGSGVAFKLAQALIIKNYPPEKSQELFEEYIDLASLGTVADLGPLLNENRYIVKRGLEILKKTKWIGLRQIMEMANVTSDNIDTNTIGFQIGPRINAAGRIGDPYIALSLLLQKEKSNKTFELSKKLEQLNRERIELTYDALEEAEEQILKNHDQLPEILIAEGPDWHVGIVGLVAGRLAERYGRPSIIMQDFGDTLVASARSLEFFDITQALRECQDLLETFGGHAQAAGFGLKKENLEKFKKRISIYTKKQLKEIELKSILDIDCEIKPEEISFDLLENLKKLEPFGVANQKPKFLLANIEPFFVDQVGKEAKHLRFKVNINNQEFTVIAFSMGHHADSIRQRRNVDIAFHLNRNVWNNRETLQLQALDIRYNYK